MPPDSTQSGYAGRPCKRIPGRHVETGDRDHRHAFVPNKMKRFASRLVKLDRSETAPLEHLAEIVKGRDEVAHRSRDVWFEVGTSDYALFRVEIDQDQRPVGERCDARYD